MEARKWQPGQSGNPGGRPKNKPISEAYNALLSRKVPHDPAGRTYAEALAEAVLKQAIMGKVPAIQEITDRVEGRVTITQEHTGAGGGAIQLTSLTPTENEARIAELLALAEGKA